MPIPGSSSGIFDGGLTGIFDPEIFDTATLSVPGGNKEIDVKLNTINLDIRMDGS